MNVVNGIAVYQDVLVLLCNHGHLLCVYDVNTLVCLQVVHLIPPSSTTCYTHSVLAAEGRGLLCVNQEEDTALLFDAAKLAVMPMQIPLESTATLITSTTHHLDTADKIFSTEGDHRPSPELGINAPLAHQASAVASFSSISSSASAFIEDSPSTSSSAFSVPRNVFKPTPSSDVTRLVQPTPVLNDCRYAVGRVQFPFSDASISEEDVLPPPPISEYLVGGPSAVVLKGSTAVAGYSDGTIYVLELGEWMREGTGDVGIDFEEGGNSERPEGRRRKESGDFSMETSGQEGLGSTTSCVPLDMVWEVVPTLVAKTPILSSHMHVRK